MNGLRHERGANIILYIYVCKTDCTAGETRPLSHNLRSDEVLDTSYVPVGQKSTTRLDKRSSEEPDDEEDAEAEVSCRKKQGLFPRF